MEKNARQAVEQQPNPLAAFIAEVERAGNPKTALAGDCDSYDLNQGACVVKPPYWFHIPLTRHMNARATCPKSCQRYRPRSSQT